MNREEKIVAFALEDSELAHVIGFVALVSLLESGGKEGGSELAHRICFATHMSLFALGGWESGPELAERICFAAQTSHLASGDANNHSDHGISAAKKSARSQHLGAALVGALLSSSF